MILGVPTLICYDRLDKLIASAEAGSVRPTKYVIVDNGRRIQEHWRARRPVVEMDIAVPAENLGVAKSWNWLMKYAGDEPLVISNDDVVLGTDTFRDLERAAHDAPFVASEGFSLFAIGKACREQVGWFDEHFYPAYYEDVDYHYRMRLAGLQEKGVAKPFSHHASSTLAAASPLQKRQIDHGFSRNREYYISKWGGDKGAEKFRTPFNGKPPEGWKERG